MTREQTIEKLKALYTNAVAAMLRADACGDDESAKVMTEYAETLDSAINALETALQTDGDCISRQAAIDATWENPSYTDPMNVLTEVRDRIKALPSVQPEPNVHDLSKDADCISRQAAIDEITEYGSGDTIYMSVAEFKRRIEHLPSIQPDNSCDGCRYENADDGVLVPCGFCERSYPDNYERRTDD